MLELLDLMLFLLHLLLLLLLDRGQLGRHERLDGFNQDDQTGRFRLNQ